ncbi:MAG TPA: hypothetical protein VFE50_20695 [Cyclobacteriaceae bacterium]|nr:hypothetical protein [Cyclobacteriaceae bacterium]
MRYILTIMMSIVSLAISAQDLGSVVASKFDAWQQKHQQFKTVLVFSQDKYAPGDTAFFNAWFLTEDGRYVGDRQILNLDMIDSDGKVVQHILFHVHDGVGANQLIIDRATLPGVYTMSSYNENMKDSDPRYVFRKRIVVVKHNAVTASPAVKKISVNNDICKIRIASLTVDNITTVVSFPKQSEMTEGDLVLAATAHGQLYFTAGFKTDKKDSLAIRLPRKDLPPGLNLLSVISRSGSQLGALHFYNPPLSPLNVSIETTNDTLSTRQKVMANVTLADANGRPLHGQFAITVSNESLAEPFEDEMNIVSQPADNRVLATEPSIVHWDEVMSNVAQESPKPPRLITRYGEVYFEDTKQFAPQGTLVNCFMKHSRFAFEGAVQENGRVELIFLDFYGSDEIFYYADYNGAELQNVRMRWVTKEITHAPALSSSEVGRPDMYANFIAKKNIVDASFDFFNGLSDPVSVAAIPPLEKEFEKMGTVVNFHDYKIFPTMSETIRELIPRLAHRTVGGKDIVRVNLSEVGLRVTGGPLYVIDGVITKNNDYFLSLSPTEVISIRVVHDSNELQRFMPVSRNGIVVVKTRKGVAGGNLITEPWLPIDGLNAPISFSKPLAARRDRGQKPEFRSTIFWQPSVRTDANGKAAFSFFTSDDTGKIRIKIRGVVNGQMFSAYHDLFVIFAE